MTVKRLSVFALMASSIVACGPAPQSHRATLDRALVEWAEHPTTSKVRVLIQTRTDAAASIRTRLTRYGATSVTSASHSGLFTSDLTPGALEAVARDRDVLHLSSDATVRSLGSVLDQDVLLGTEGLLPRTYSGANVGVAVIDSGILPNANEKVVLT